MRGEGVLDVGAGEGHVHGVEDAEEEAADSEDLEVGDERTGADGEAGEGEIINCLSILLKECFLVARESRFGTSRAPSIPPAGRMPLSKARVDASDS